MRKKLTGQSGPLVFEAEPFEAARTQGDGNFTWFSLIILTVTVLMFRDMFF